MIKFKIKYIYFQSFNTYINPIIRLTRILDEYYDPDSTPQKDLNEEIHYGIECTSCYVIPIRGMRYRCSECPKYNLCSYCMSKGIHKHHVLRGSHNRIARPSITQQSKNITRITYAR